MSVKTKTIEPEALAVLAAGRCEGQLFYLPPTQLDRKLYDRVNAVLDALGGKWNRSKKAHVFGEHCEDLIDGAVATGTYTRPSDMGWFPTPPVLAERIAAMANIREGDYVLEPSAGEGALCKAILKYTGAVVAYEIDELRAQRCLSYASVAPYRDDFLTVDPRAEFDRVVMNPPFAKRADIHHVLHAYKFLAPGGRLVAIMSAGVEFRDDAMTRDFRSRIDSLERLPDDSFKPSGTSVRTVVVTMSRED